MSDLPAPQRHWGARSDRQEVGRGPGESHRAASVDEILAAWAGGARVPAPQSTPAATESIAEDRDGDSAPAAASATEAPAPPLPAAPSAVAEVVAAPVVTEVNAQEALRYPAVVTVPTAGLLERTVGVDTSLAGGRVLHPPSIWPFAAGLGLKRRLRARNRTSRGSRHRRVGEL